MPRVQARQAAAKASFLVFGAFLSVFRHELSGIKLYLQTSSIHSTCSVRWSLSTRAKRFWAFLAHVGLTCRSATGILVYFASCNALIIVQ